MDIEIKTKKGKNIKLDTKDIPLQGRATKGKRLIGKKDEIKEVVM